MFETVQYEVKGKIAELTLHRPKAINAFDLQMHEEFYMALQEADENSEVRSIVIKGSGRGYSAGADLSAIQSGQGASVDLGEYLRKTYNREIHYMTQIEKPIISSIHGPAFGAGLGVALASDFRIADRSSSFCLAFVKIGLVPDAGTTFFLPRIVGLSRAMELAALGDTIQAEEAYRIGLLNRLVDEGELENETLIFASRLAEMPTKAIGTMKKAIYRSFESDLKAVLELEAEGQSAAGATHDHTEGVKAFFEKRKAAFTGQ